MPRIRTLKPEALQHRKVGRLSDRAYRLWTGLITQADDDGRLLWDARQFKLLVWGYHDAMSPAKVEAALEEIRASGLCRRYSVDAQALVDLPSWHDHQRINRATKSNLPPYKAETDDSLRAHGAFTEHSLIAHGSLTGDRIGSEGSDRIGGEGGEPEGNHDQPAGFRLNAEILAALQKAPRLGSVPKLSSPTWWQAEVRANPGVDFAAEVLKAEAWLTANSNRAPRKDLSRFLHTWLSRADRDGA